MATPASYTRPFMEGNVFNLGAPGDTRAARPATLEGRSAGDASGVGVRGGGGTVMETGLVGQMFEKTGGCRV